MPRTFPAASTSVIEPRAALPKGWRIAARVMSACCAACEMMRCTSAAVRAFGDAEELPVNGKKRVSIAPLTPPTLTGTNDDGCAARTGEVTEPGSEEKGIVEGRGASASVTLR